MALAEHNIDNTEQIRAGENVIQKCKISPVIKITEVMKDRVRVSDTDIGQSLKEKIKDLQTLVKAYEEGTV